MTPWSRTITQTDMIVYAGATWDWHEMHYTGTAPIVDGQMLGALMASYVKRESGRLLKALAFRFRSPVTAGETVRLTGEATDDGVYRLAVHVGDRLVCDGEART